MLQRTGCSLDQLLPLLSQWNAHTLSSGLSAPAVPGTALTWHLSPALAGCSLSLGLTGWYPEQRLDGGEIWQ